jgi:hypothetical protein
VFGDPCAALLVIRLDYASTLKIMNAISINLKNTISAAFAIPLAACLALPAAAVPVDCSIIRGDRYSRSGGINPAYQGVKQVQHMYISWNGGPLQMCDGLDGYVNCGGRTFSQRGDVVSSRSNVQDVYSIRYKSYPSSAGACSSEQGYIIESYETSNVGEVEGQGISVKRVGVLKTFYKKRVPDF